jgi:hypothetical protein
VPSASYPNPYEDYDEQQSGELGKLDTEWVRKIGLKPTYPPPLAHPEELDPTDIYHMAVNLFGFRISIADFGGRPDVLAFYVKDPNRIIIDYQLLATSVSGLPAGRAMQAVIDRSPAARFMLGWCVATHTVGMLDKMVVGFVPHDTPFSKPELERLARTWETVANTFAPEERLLKQAEELGIDRHLLCRPDWYEVVPNVNAVISALAARNNCLPLLVELQLMRWSSQVQLTHVFFRLWQESPIFQLKAARAEKYLATYRSLGLGRVKVRFMF